MKSTAQSGGKSAAQPAAPAPVILSYKFPLAPCAHQHAALQRILDDQRDLYNAALEERIGSYEWAKRHSAAEFAEAKRAIRKTTSYYGQSVTMREIRAMLPEYGDVSALISRGTLQRLEKAYQAFFERVKKGGPPGFPEFKPARFFKTLEINQSDGFRVKGNQLRVKGVPGGMRIRLHRPLPGKPKALRLTRELNHVEGKAKGKPKALRHKRQMDHVKGKAKWWVSFAVEVEGKPRPSGKPAIGVDAGVKALAACSDGKRYEGIQAGRDGLAELSRAQRAFQRRRKVAKRSGNWNSRGFARSKERVRRAHKRVANVRDNHGHHVANAIVGRASLVAVEDLNVRGMMAKGGAHKRGLNRSIGDAAMGALIGKLRYKADVSGVEFVEVSARGTSQACSGCGAVVKKGLEVRVHNCPKCGLKLDRDVNAARNILQRALQGKEGAAQ
ncbi:MAG: transposase [Deltaproteobacteria bacterium]|nr:transposase [Deltaproteobacteria bacterium]